ncbi:MAG: DNA polymerase I [Oscillospiraceae bacterium]|nr:DNA polymerase I [Oscillospiraceae bacterium]
MKMMVIDGNSIVNRSFYGIRMLNTRDGRPTNAVYGFLTTLLKMLDEEQPDGVCCTFDMQAPTFRHQAYADYKGKRKAMPDELAQQLPVLKQVLEAMKVPYYQLEGWEADDLIATIARRCTEKGWETVVVTGDRDTLQLISDTTTVDLVTTRGGQTTTKRMTPDAFREEYGFDPIHMIDLKALMGDSSDNIPGVSGIGEKTATDLVRRYGSIDKIYADLDAVEAKPAVLKKLEAGEKDARMSYDLATIRDDAPIQFEPEDARRQPPDEKELYRQLVDLEFLKLIDRLGLKAPGGDAPAGDGETLHRCDGEIVSDEKRSDQLLDLFSGLEAVCFVALNDLSGVAVQWNEGEDSRAAVFFSHRLGDGYDRFLRRFFSAEISKVNHDNKTTMTRLLDEGLSTDGFVFDTAVAAYLLAPTDGSYQLERLAVSYFHVETKSDAVYQTGGVFSSLGEDRAALDTWLEHTALVEALHRTLAPRLKELDLERVFEQADLPLCPVLSGMEHEGFLVDRQALDAFGKQMTERIAQKEKEIYRLAGEEFNINSTQQLGRILFEKLGLPAAKKTKHGYSTSVDVLEKLVDKHPIIQQVLDYRQYTKLNSTYVDGLSKDIGPDGRIHTTFQNTVTATGRLSSADPNLQNIPVRTELGGELRYMFIARPGWVLVDADYSQIELRLLAHISGDREMQADFQRNEDIHTATAAAVFGVDPDQVTGELRRRAKVINFGIIYGISAFSLAQDMGVTRKQAGEYMDRYFARFPGVAAYMKDVVEKAKKDGYVTTLLGRRRWLPELNSSNFHTRSFGERVALNMPIQGTAADIIKMAMIRVDRALTRGGLQGRLVLQVHDELIVECPEEEQEKIEALLVDEMEQVVSLSVPLAAQAGAGKSWGDAKP